MSILFSAMTWLAPLGLLLIWQWSIWREKHPEVQFSDWLRADPYIAGLIIAQAIIIILPLGLWLILASFFIISIIFLIKDEQQRKEWMQRKFIRSLALIFLISMHLISGFVPVSEPTGENVWGTPLIEESENSPLWPASEQYVWLLNDGTIIVETHFNTPGVLNPLLSSWGAKEYSQVSGAKESRFEEAASLLDDWAGPNAFTLASIHDGVVHDYDGEKLLYTHDEVMLDLLGMHPSGEMITVWKPTWGGEMHLLSVIKVGSDPFVGNPGAQKYVVDWLSNE